MFRSRRPTDVAEMTQPINDTEIIGLIYYHHYNVCTANQSLHKNATQYSNKSQEKQYLYDCIAPKSKKPN